jgi:hypothetical protein
MPLFCLISSGSWQRMGYQNAAALDRDGGTEVYRSTRNFILDDENCGVYVLGCCHKRKKKNRNSQI